MPLTEKGEKIKGAMEKQYGAEKGEKVFYASKNKGTITGVDDDDYVELEKGKSPGTINKNEKKLQAAGHNPQAAKGIAQRKARGDDLKPGWKIDIAFPNERSDDNQHLGFTGNQALAVEELTDDVNSLTKRLDAFEKWNHQRKPTEVEPRNKDNMQPSNRHPKEVDG
jgi:hypothetical protein